MTGLEKVQKWLTDSRASKLPKVAAEYEKLPAGFRKLLAVQAGIPAAAEKNLDELTESQRGKLIEAVGRLSLLAAQAGELLRRSQPARLKRRG